MRRFITGLVFMCSMLPATPGALAKKNVPEFELAFLPQQTIAGAEAMLDLSMLRRSGRIELLDGRDIADASVIGKRTDDDDHTFTLRATNDVISFVEQAMMDAAREWGMSLSAKSELTLRATLERLHVLETNQAVGATYKANVVLVADLVDETNTVLWFGYARGDATRWGKKFSSENSNEVLSDAILEAWAELLDSPGLGEAWSGHNR